MQTGLDVFNLDFCVVLIHASEVFLSYNLNQHMSELEKKIVDDLEKSGFGTEMRALKIFLDAGWTCQGSPSFYDKDNHQTREFDLQADFRVTSTARGS